MTVPCRQCSTPVDPSAAVCPVCGAANPGQRHGPPPGPGGASASYATVQRTGGEHVVITGVDIPFGRMVMLILKVMIASIPAYILLMIIFFMIFALVGGIAGVMMPELFSGGGGGMEGL
ncbi:MAG: hypothetical protein AVDCRST_MAG89-4375 [uncultured Gemmatimonadetes bacterium]|uniref:Zinc-ribbon domain-containing protein n=1 Tax=uncultured Gemmatimonadota bacterium TaxID=203437 RepID=A0A6J4MVU8_9BACT|nr:MAG: hypothetical protein AVDCRST_MAG89-4375 [uncultured Gemmatimonadota bacterium]